MATGIKKQLFFITFLIVSNGFNWCVSDPVQMEKPDMPVIGKRVRVDAVSLVIHGPERSEIVCLSDKKRRGIDSREKTDEMLIDAELVFQDALKFKVPVEPSVVKEHLARTMRAFGFKPGDEAAVFAQEGYTYEEGLEHFKKMYAQQAIVEHRVKTGLMVTEDEVLAYHNSHPIVKPPQYVVQTAFIPFEKESGKKIRGIELDVDKYIKTGKGLDVAWSDSYRLLEGDIAEALHFITTMDIGQVQKYKIDQGIQLYKLVGKKPQRTVALQKRYKEIADYLIKPKYEERLAQYYKKLREAATIVYL